MEPLPLIPTPPSLRWREFRIRAIPVITFAVGLFSAAILWQQSVAPPTLVGEVEPIQANVTSSKSGLLAQIDVSRFQVVKAGDPVAQVITTEPKILASSLAVIQAEIGLLRATLEPALGLRRNELSYDKFRLDWMETRTRLATARVSLQLADTELRRMEELFRDKIVSELLLDQAKAAKARFQVEVDELTKLVAEQEQNLEALRLREGPQAELQAGQATADALRAAVNVQEEKLRLTEAQLSPLTLKVPVDGMVSMIHRRSGETIMAGEPILTISVPHSDRIMGYLRQPFPLDPKVGMQVRVCPRSLKREFGLGEIVHVGAQMEPITNAVFRRPGIVITEVGLPIQVSLPLDLKVRPGEIVDLTILPSTK